MTDNSKYPEEGDKMDNNFGTADILTGRGLGLGGFGGYGQGYGPYTTPTSLQHSIDGNRQFIENGFDAVRDCMSLTTKNIGDNFENATRSREFSSIKDGQFASELRTNDRLLALQAEINANAREAAKCCCDVKLEACKNTAEIMASASRDKAEILASISAIKDRELAAANAELTALKTVNALSGHGHGRS